MMATTDPEKIKAAKARYRERHRDELRAKGRAYMSQRRAADPEFAERERERSRSIPPEKRRQINAAHYARYPEELRGRRRQAYYDDPEAARASSRRYYETHVEERREAARRRRSERPELQAAADRRYRVRHPEKMQAKNAQRRMRMQAAAVEAINRAAVYERDGGRCHICRRRCSAKRFHLDHLVPLSRGGSHTYENVAVAHPRCNLRRGAGRLPAQLRIIG